LDNKASSWLPTVALGALVLASPLAGTRPWAESANTIPIAVVAPVRGQAAAIAFGAQVLKPVKLGIRELNAGGGLLDRKLDLKLADDECDPALAIRAANSHIDQEKIGAVIGPICPGAAASAAPIYGKAGVPQLLPTVSLAMLGAMRPNTGNIFSMVPTDEEEARALADHLVREHTAKNLTVVYTDAFYRTGLIKALKAALPAEMQKSARFEPLLDISGLYDRLVDSLQRQQPDVIYLALDHGPLVRLLAKLRQRPIKASLVGGHHLLSYNFWLESQGPSEGIHVVAPIGTPTTPEFRVAVDRLAEAGIIPDLVALNSYASVQILAQAIRRIGSADPRRVAEAMREHLFQTAVGPVAFDQQGNRRDPRYSFVTWQSGRPRFVHRLQ
jgi:branched-chain amino acid transport system substrate-binding protein